MMQAAPAGEAWLRHEASDAAARLICIPHAGGGAASFSRWLGLFPPAITAVRVQLPGREDVAAQPPLHQIHDAVAGLLPPVRRLSDTPVALYGHSMGALIAFELARALHTAGNPPVYLFVSGRRAPRLAASRAAIHRLPDDAFAAALKDLGGETRSASRSAALRRYALRLTRADLELCENYVYRPGRRLPCPVMAFHGTEDPIVDAAEAEAWQDETAAAFEMHSYPGGHFFHRHHRAVIVVNICKALEGVVPGTAGQGREKGAARDIAS